MRRGLLISIFFVSAGLVLVGTFLLDENFIQRMAQIKRDLRHVSWEQVIPVDPGPTLKTYNLAISPKRLDQLADDRAAYMQKREGGKLKVRGALTLDGQTVPVRVTYRGYGRGHWEGRRMSFRLDAEKGRMADAMTSVNLIVPEQRNYLNDAFSQYLAERFGLIAARWDFVHLYLNGEYMGVQYALEQLDADAMERKGYPNSQLWTEVDMPWDAGWVPIYENPARFRNAYAKKGRNASVQDIAPVKRLLDALREPSEHHFAQSLKGMVDWDNFCRWQAHQVLLTSPHQDYWHNNRLLWDPSAGKFQFVPTDLAFGDWSYEAINATAHPLVARALNNPALRLDRDRALWAYVRDDEHLRWDLDFFDGLYERTKRAFWADRSKPHSGADFNARFAAARAQYEKRYRSAQKSLQRCEVFVIAEPHAAVAESARGSRIEVMAGTDSPAGARLRGMRVSFGRPFHGTLQLYRADGPRDDPAVPIAVFASQDGGKTHSAFCDALIPSGLKLCARNDAGLMLYQSEFHNSLFRVAPLHAEALPEFSGVQLDVENAVTQAPARVVLRVADTRTFARWEERFASPQSFYLRYPYLRPDVQNPAVLIWPAGNYILREDMMVPEGVTLRLEPGVTLRMAQDVSILCWGRIEASGRPDAPIVFRALTFDKPWGVLALIQQPAAAMNTFRHCAFLRGGKGPKQSVQRQGMQFMGTLSCAGGQAVLEHCRFLSNTGEDALNIRRSKATVQECVFRDNRGDGVDLDFVTDGSVRQNVFLTNGDDAVDLSGSRVRIEDNRIEHCRGKGISVGENSQPLISDCFIAGCGVGVAVKDGSRAELADCVITGNRVGLALYRKKHFFVTGGNVSLRNVAIGNNQENATMDSFSSLTGAYHALRGASEQDVPGNGPGLAAWSGVPPSPKTSGAGASS